MTISGDNKFKNEAATERNEKKLKEVPVGDWIEQKA